MEYCQCCKRNYKCLKMHNKSKKHLTNSKPCHICGHKNMYNTVYENGIIYCHTCHQEIQIQELVRDFSI